MKKGELKDYFDGESFNNFTKNLRESLLNKKLPEHVKKIAVSWKNKEFNIFVEVENPYLQGRYLGVILDLADDIADSMLKADIFILPNFIMQENIGRYLLKNNEITIVFRID
jgi:hypothetical protein